MSVLEFIGLIGLLCFIIRFLISIIPSLLKQQNLLSKYHHPYALVTGGTDGIGYNITQKLISQGFHVCVVGLESSKSHEQFLFDNSKLIIGNLSDENTVEQIKLWVQEKKPSLFINAAGICIPQPFLKINSPSNYVKAFISSTVEITQTFIANCPKKSGIVFFSSQVAHFSSPFASLYASTKAFIAQFSLSLSSEFPNIDILVLHPGAVNGTSFFNHFPNHWFFNLIRFFGNSKEYVASLVFKAIGRVRTIDCGIYMHLTRIVNSLIPDNLIGWAAHLASGDIEFNS